MENEADQFKSFLKRKSLSDTSVKHYMDYYKHLSFLINQLGYFNQDVVNGFIDIYSHALGKAMLKNYFEFKDVNYRIPKKTGTTPKKEIKILSPQEIEVIRKRLWKQHDRFGLIFDLTYACALRRQEVINIKGEDISWMGDEAMKIKIVKAKGGKERFVIVKGDVAERLLIYMSNNNITLNQYLFESPMKKGHPIHKTLWNKAFGKASGKRFHPHLLRHSKSTEWFDKGIDIVRIQQRLGHSDISTTRRYINPDAKKELQRWSEEE